MKPKISKKELWMLRDWEESRLYQPDHVDENRCMALIMLDGVVKGVQCCESPAKGKDLCRRHYAAKLGRVRGVLPNRTLRDYRIRECVPEKVSKQWYSRHLMWHYANEMDSDLQSLTV